MLTIHLTFILDLFIGSLRANVSIDKGNPKFTRKVIHMVIPYVP